MPGSTTRREAVADGPLNRRPSAAHYSRDTLTLSDRKLTLAWPGGAASIFEASPAGSSAGKGMVTNQSRSEGDPINAVVAGA